MLDSPMEPLIKKLHLSDDILQALVHQTGPLFPCLQLIQFYETGRWSELDAAIQQLKIESENITTYYLDAVRWSGYFVG